MSQFWPFVIAGLTTGLAFARKGWHVRVHVQDSDLRILGAGIYIWENGLRVLDALDVLDPVIVGTIPASRHEKRNHDGSVFSQSRLAGDFRRSDVLSDDEVPVGDRFKSLITSLVNR